MLWKYALVLPFWAIFWWWDGEYGLKRLRVYLLQRRSSREYRVFLLAQLPTDAMSWWLFHEYLAGFTKWVPFQLTQQSIWGLDLDFSYLQFGCARPKVRSEFRPYQWKYSNRMAQHTFLTIKLSASWELMEPTLLLKKEGPGKIWSQWSKQWNLKPAVQVATQFQICLDKHRLHRDLQDPLLDS